ncbi:MAG: hypothetical protein ABI811_03070 [Acidobacteriota bacterium]
MSKHSSIPGMAIAFCCLLASTLPAQWLHYPTAGVPKNKQGKPNLQAPTPRTRDGKPDFSGLWWIAGPARACPEHLGGPGDCIEKGLGLANQGGADLASQAVNIATDLAGGLPYQPWAAQLVQQRSREVDPHVRCLPSNFPRFYTLPHVQKVIQTPGLLVMLNEYNSSYRQIFTDGRPLPEDPQPSWNGYSSAKWERDTLVVHTIGFRDDLWLDMAGNPLTEAAKVTERIRRPNYGSLEIDITVDDAKAYTKPWTVKIQLFLVLDTELVDEICLENEKSAQHMTGK